MNQLAIIATSKESRGPAARWPSTVGIIVIAGDLHTLGAPGGNVNSSFGSSLMRNICNSQTLIRHPYTSDQTTDYGAKVRRTDTGPWTRAKRCQISIYAGRIRSFLSRRIVEPTLYVKFVSVLAKNLRQPLNLIRTWAIGRQ